MKTTPNGYIGQCKLCSNKRWCVGGVCFRCSQQLAEAKHMALTALGWRFQDGKWIRPAEAP